MTIAEKYNFTPLNDYMINQLMILDREIKNQSVEEKSESYNQLLEDIKDLDLVLDRVDSFLNGNYGYEYYYKFWSLSNRSNRVANLFRYYLRLEYKLNDYYLSKFWKQYDQKDLLNTKIQELIDLHEQRFIEEY